jgi:hypothetical protein
MTPDEIIALLNKPILDENELQKLVDGVAGRIRHLPTTPGEVVQIKVSMELIRAIRRFDEASGVMAERSNKLNRRLLYLTIVMLVVGILGAVASGWPYLVWWLINGFRYG